MENIKNLLLKRIRKDMHLLWLHTIALKNLKIVTTTFINFLGINSLLSIVEPHQIFIADNGSTREEQLKTRNICKRYSRCVSFGDMGKLNEMLDNDNDTTNDSIEIEIENDSDVIEPQTPKDNDSIEIEIVNEIKIDNIDLDSNLDYIEQLNLRK
jgi:hypothetical protein